MRTDVGTCVVRREYGPGTCDTRMVVERADDLVAISPELLMAKNDPRWFSVAGDGHEVVICGEYLYRSTGEYDNGCPLYRLVSAPAVPSHVATPKEEL